jgi:flagellar biosynthetic protein FliP
LLVGFALLVATPAFAQDVLPSIQLSVGQASTPQEVSQGLQVLVLLTVLTLAPSLLIMATSFTRMVIVLSLVRQAMGTPTLPPNQVLISLALILSFFVMTPTLTAMNEQALQPYLNGKLSQQVALERAAKPLQAFMLKQTYQKDVALFIEMAKVDPPAPPEALWCFYPFW